MIDALEKYDIPATFFIVTQRLVGKHGEKSRELLARELGRRLHSSAVTRSPTADLGKADDKQLDREMDASLEDALERSEAADRPVSRAVRRARTVHGRVRLKQARRHRGVLVDRHARLEGEGRRRSCARRSSR